MTGSAIHERLEMLLVMQWLDEGAPQEGTVRLSVATAAAELGLDGREELLAIMRALGDLEARGALTVAWPGGVGAREGAITLAPDLRRDARSLFGRAEGPGG